MSSIEERNVTALERWMHEVFEEGNLDLAVELMAPSYVGHGPAGTVTHTPESYLAVIEKMRSNAPWERYEVHDLIARGGEGRPSILDQRDEPADGEAKASFNHDRNMAFRGRQAHIVLGG
jgi:hypothetical protein